MGGDNAPHEVVRGTMDAARVYPDMRLILVGREDAIREELSRCGGGEPNVEVVSAEHVIDMAPGAELYCIFVADLVDLDLDHRAPEAVEHREILCQRPGQ